MANPWPWLSTKLTSNAASSLHRLINSASLERQVSSSKIVAPTGSRLPKSGNSPYRPPLVVPGGPSQTTKENSLGISVTGAWYQSKSPYPISGEKQTRTPEMRLRVRTSCTRFCHSAECSSDQTSTPRRPQRAPRRNVVAPLPHSRTG